MTALSANLVASKDRHPERVALRCDELRFTYAEFDACSRVVVTGGKLTLERRPDLEVRQVLPDRVSSQLVGAAMVRRSDSEGHGPVWQTTATGPARHDPLE